MTKGLSSAEAAQRIKTLGFNELPTSHSKNILLIALEVIKEPMFILLISCGSLYLLLGDYTEGLILLCWVFVIIFITFFQHQKTEKALNALKKLSSPRALVIRDEKEIRIAGREVVPDDLVILNEGDRVPADGILQDCLNLTIDESMLTGESMPVTKTSQSENDINCRVFSGTLVVHGRGVMEVSKTGINTEYGKIGKSLQLIEQDQTNLQREMKTLIRNLFIAGAGLSIVVILAFYFTRGNFVQSLLNGLATAMAMLPEEFPVVLTVFLAIGSLRLSQKNVLTRKSSTIEALGSATVLCSDKTGTITQNKMEIASLFFKKELFHKSKFKENASNIQDILKVAFYASQNNTCDPMEKAIGVCFEKYVVKENVTYDLMKEYPLSNDLFAMTRILKLSDNAYEVYSKGSPEAILSLCKLKNTEETSLFTQVQFMAEKGQRILGLSKAKWNNSTFPDSQAGFNFEFIGFLGFEDPIRQEVPQSIKECYDAGIKVIMITGDYPSTAKSIALQVGMEKNRLMLTGTDLMNLSDKELKEKIKSVNIFARIVPEQKLQIIRALKANGEVVAMTGDGVNDAPALKAADIGIAMGGKGTDVARESSSLVLLDDNFSSIVSAIRAGRKIFDNLQKAMSYIIAIHIPIIGLTLLPAFFPGLPILLMPLHIVFMELIIDPVCSIAFESEKEEKGIMDRPPRKPNMQFFGFKKIFSSAAMGFLLLAMVVAVYFLAISENHTDGEIRAIAFSSLIIGNIFLILTTLSKTRNFIMVILEKNIALLVIIIAASGLMVLLISAPYLQSIFSFDYPGLSHFSISIIGAAIVLLILEIIKYSKMKFKMKLL
ncbi:MAG: cation-translocating P-type ATPase [Lutibacter sp.]